MAQNLWISQASGTRRQNQWVHQGVPVNQEAISA